MDERCENEKVYAGQNDFNFLAMAEHRQDTITAWEKSSSGDVIES